MIRYGGAMVRVSNIESLGIPQIHSDYPVTLLRFNLVSYAYP